MFGSGIVTGLKNSVRVASQRLGPRYYRVHGGVARLTRAGSRTIIASHAGKDPNAGSRRWAVFVHYDRSGAIHDYVVTFLRSLQACGYRIRLMSNAPRLPGETIDRVAPYVAQIQLRNNYGFDFGAYKDGIAGVLAEDPDELLICNDSVYGPFQDLAAVLEHAPPAGADVWGLTESYEYAYHLQTYFVLFHRRALQHEAFRRFWESAPYVDARGWLIHHGEVALTQSLLGAGLSVRSVFSTDRIYSALVERIEDYEQKLAQEEKVSYHDRRLHGFRLGIVNCLENGTPLNPTHFTWDVLIENLGFPFIKRDLIQLNPAHIPSLAVWHQLVARASDYDPEQIRQHLLPRLKHRSI